MGRDGLAPVAHGIDAGLAVTSPTVARIRAFHTLDALRGVAALAIVFFHAAFVYGLAPPAEGQIAVDLFFVMSGFIIAYRYDTDLRRGLGVRRFALIRLIRLYPLFLLGTVLGVLPTLIAVLAGRGDALHRGLIESFPLALVMLPSRFALPTMQELYPLNYVAWSLALEIVVNIAYAATFRFWSVRHLVIVIASAFVGLCVCAGVYGRLKYGYAWPQVPVGLVRVVYGFAMGVLIFRLHAERPVAIRVPWWLLLAAAVSIFVFDPPAYRQVWEVFAVGVLVPAIVVAAVVSEPPRALRPACAVAGIFSYVLYSLHAPFVGLFLRGENRVHLDLHVQTPTEAATFTALILALCVVAHVAYDQPVRRWLTRRLKSPAPAPLPAAS